MPLCDELPEIEHGVIGEEVVVEVVAVELDDDGPALLGPGLGPGSGEEAGEPRSRGSVFGSPTARLGPTASAHSRDVRRESKSALMPSVS